MGLKTYGKGHPDLIARLQVHVSGVWQRLWLLAIQLMTLPSPVAHQYVNHKEILECSQCLHDRRLLLGTWNVQKHVTVPTCGFVTMAPLFFFFLMQVAMSGTSVSTPPSLDGLGWKQFFGVCCSLLLRNHVGQALPSFSRRVPLGVNKSGKGERYVSD